ncbi:hypothetical protein [Nostoc sp. NZL]|uniref:hypothetical protein n=1 Tax=Nostoc sp. NZL TaxID=2650612 RepID=UPI001E52C815|nr:hypothetical protein [Nostoc sp. NZL]MBG1244663.1 hypothetical protein [Nostoc sp. NZL]
MRLPICPIETNILTGNFLHKIQMLTLNTRKLYGKPMLHQQFRYAIAPAPMLHNKTLSCA